MSTKPRLPHVVGSTVAVAVAAILSVPAALLGGALVQRARPDTTPATVVVERAVPATTPPTTAVPATTQAAPTTPPSTASTATPTTPPTTAATGLVADFTWSPENPGPGDSVRLIDRSTGGAVRWMWKWNRNSISTSKPGGISTSVNADTAITLTVCDGNDECVTTTKTIVVTA